MPKRLSAVFGLAVAFLLSTAASTGMVYARQVDLSIVLREDRPEQGDRERYSYIYIAPAKTDTDLRQGDRPVQAVISLPLPDKPSQSPASPVYDLPPRFEVRANVVSVTPNNTPRLKRDYVEVTLTERQSEWLDTYVGDRQLGKRFEPVIEVKNLLVDHVETTFISVVPVGLTLEFDAENSAFLNGEVVLKAVYVPAKLENTVTDPKLWKVSQNGANGAIMCGVKYDSLVNERQVGKFTFAVQGLAANGEGTLEFSPELTRLRQNTQLTAFNTAQSDPVRFVPTQTITNLRRQPRTGQRPRPSSFSFGSPVVPQDYPVYARAEFTSSKNASGGHDRAVGFDININVDPDADSLSPLRAFEIAGVDGLTFAPAFKMKMSNVLSEDNENSLRWFAPVGYNLKHGPVCLVQTQTCTKPFFRGVTFLAGLNGEHSAYGQNQNMVVPIGATLYFRNINTPARKDWEASLDIFLGYEAGKVIDTTSAAYFEVGEERQQVALTPVQKTAIGRFHGQAKFSVGLGKSRSFNFQWDRWELRREEQYLKAREIEGSFTPGSAVEIGGQVVTTVPGQKLTVYDPEYRKGFRHYFEGKFLWELAPHVSFDISYTKGEMAPTFQHVNKVTVGIAYQIKP